ncbi:MAG: chromate transporter [Candidatus Caldatribacteriota bacterium]
MKILIELITSFIIIGFAACGGGLVTIPLIQHEMVSIRHWITFNELARLLAIAQMTPGPIAINAATFVGFQIAGITGAIMATLAVIFPALIILFSLTPIFNKVKHNEKVKRISRGIQLGVLSLILFAIWSFGSRVIKGWLDLLIAIASFLILIIFKNKIHPVLVIILCGIIGLIIY